MKERILEMGNIKKKLIYKPLNKLNARDVIVIILLIHAALSKSHLTLIAFANSFLQISSFSSLSRLLKTLSRLASDMFSVSKIALIASPNSALHS